MPDIKPPSLEVPKLESKPEEMIRPEIQKVPEEALSKETMEQKPSPSEEVPQKVTPVAFPPSPLPEAPKDPLTIQIERILEEGLTDFYSGLSPQIQAKFKKQGEEVASTIRQMTEQAKVRIRKILKIIRKWLALIPGINRYFLEQESIIKTEKIMNFARYEEEKKRLLKKTR